MVNVAEEKDLDLLRQQIRDLEWTINELKARISFLETTKQNKVSKYPGFIPDQPFMPYPVHPYPSTNPVYAPNPVPDPMRPWCSGGVPDPT